MFSSGLLEFEDQEEAIESLVLPFAKKEGQVGEMEPFKSWIFAPGKKLRAVLAGSRKQVANLTVRHARNFFALQLHNLHTRVLNGKNSARSLC